MLDKVKSLRGSLYRKAVSRKQKKELPPSLSRSGQMLLIMRNHQRFERYPKFTVRENKMTSLPPPHSVSFRHVIYPLITPYAYANVKYDEKDASLVYNVMEPKLTKKESVIFEKLKDGLMQVINVGISDIKTNEKIIDFLEEKIQHLLKEFGIDLTDKEYSKILYYIFRDFVGLNEVEPLLKDPYIEDIGVDGTGIPVYIVHQRFGSIRTNVIYDTEAKLREFVTKLAERCDRYISYAEPLLDGTLPDGARVQASLASDVTTRGPTFSIRKFREVPLSPVDIIRYNTASPEMLAYIWYLVENGANILLAGGVSTGKTSMLNAISMFIPSELKIVSIEDSVTGDAEIIVRKDDKTRITKIGELIDGLLEESGEKEKVKNEDIEVLTMDADYKMTFKKAGSFIRHLVNKDIYEITTSTGRKVKVTQDHSLFGLDGNGEIKEITPLELKEVEFLATPRTIPWEGNETKTINLLDYPDAFRGDFITGDIGEIFEKVKYEKFKEFGVGIQKYRYWKKNKIIETSVFRRLAVDIEPQRLKITGKRPSRSLPAIFEISDEFLEFLGLWVGDGSYDGYNKNRVIISNIDSECIKCVKNVAEKLGIKVSLMPDKVSMSINSTLLYKFMKALGFVGYAHTKRVPEFIHSLSKRQVSSFLRGYFSANGSVKNFELRCSSQSLNLLNDVQTLLLRFEIISRISHYKRKDKCRELCISSSENIMPFNEIGFLQARKMEKIDIIGARKSHHAKTDIVPLGTGLLKEINKFEKLSWPYQQGMQNIGRPYLEEISDEADSEILSRLANSDIFWDKLREVRKLPRKDIYVYDISVPETENFVCSNILLHNTRELNLPHENWIPGVARAGFTGTGVGEVDMFQLLKESFRQNPDYLIVGEIRGKEAYVMFQGMASIPGEQKVLVVNDNNLKRIPIGSLNAKSTFKVPTFDFNNNIVKLSHFSKVEHSPTNELYKITTSTGRSITTTAHHSLFTFKNGRVETVPSHEMKNSDSIVIPGLLPSGFNDIGKLDLIEMLPEVRIFAPGYVKQAVEKLGYEEASKAAGVAGISDYYANFAGNSQSSLHAKKFFSLMEAAGIKYDKEEIFVKFDRKSESFPAMLQITPELLRLIGYFISEGSLSKSRKNSRISLYSKDKIILEDMRKCIMSVTRKTPKERETRGFGVSTELSFNHKVLFELLKIQSGENGKTRKIPDFIFGLSKQRIGEFLSGLYNGDGSFGRYAFSYYTISEELASDLAQLLMSYGIVTSIIKRQRKGRKTTDYEIKFYTYDEKTEFLKYITPLKKAGNLSKGRKNRKKIGDLYIDKVKSIEKIMLENPVKVYDLCVPSTQNFVGGFGGIVLHNSGHPSLSTIHAGGINDLIKRLETEPINLSPGLLESLDAVIVMVHAREHGKSARRVKEIVEVESIDLQSGQPRINKSFSWLPSEDSFLYKGNSWLLNKISGERGTPMSDIVRDISRRKKFLSILHQNNVTKMEDVAKYINVYRRNPKRVDSVINGTQRLEDII